MSVGPQEPILFVIKTLIFICQMAQVHMDLFLVICSHVFFATAYLADYNHAQIITIHFTFQPQ